MVKKGPNINKIIRQIFSKPKDFIFFIVFSVLLTGFAIASVVVAGSFVNAIFLNNDQARISFYIAPLILLVIGFAASFILMGRFKSNITANITKELKQDAYLALLQAEMSEFDKDNYEKEVSHFEKNVEKVSEDYIGNNILSFVNIMILMIGFFIMGLVIEPIYAFILLAIIPLYTTADKTCSVFVSRAQKHYNDEIKKNSEVTNDTIKNLKNIKILSGIDSEYENYEEVNNNLIKATHEKNVSLIISRFVLPLLFIGIAIAAMWGVGGLMKEAGNIVKISSFVVFMAVVPVVILSTYQAFHYNLKGSYVESEVLAIEKITGLRSEIRSEPIKNLDDIRSIKFDGVSISDKNILNNVSFEIKQGEKIGIFSLNKDTRDEIFDLITKINKPDSGIITFNNCELNRINAKYIRTLITAIYDDSHVFNDTIMNNICYAREFDEYKYNDALYRSGIKQLISTFDERDQKVLQSEEVSEFNTRVIFANAFYQDNKIYLINDACKGMDAQLEVELINEVYKLKNKTVIVETDKPYLLNKCDKIMVIENGEIVEFAPYKELMSDKQSRYYRLIKGPGSRKTKVS